jgi:hypothetical protein
MHRKDCRLVRLGEQLGFQPGQLLDCALASKLAGNRGVHDD